VKPNNLILSDHTQGRGARIMPGIMPFLMHVPWKI
jgi:hypothetical protein